VVTLLSNGLPLEMGPATAPGEQAASPPSGEPATAHGAALAGGDSTEVAPEPQPVPPLAGPNLIEALEKLRLLPAKAEEEAVPPPAPGPVQEAPPPVPQEVQPPVAPLDPVWSDLAWLKRSSPLPQAEMPLLPAGIVPKPMRTTVEVTRVPAREAGLSSERLNEAVSLPAANGQASGSFSHALALLGILGLRRAWRGWTREEPQRSTGTRRKHSP
jgi:hypothetical protein